MPSFLGAQKTETDHDHDPGVTARWPARSRRRVSCWGGAVVARMDGCDGGPAGGRTAEMSRFRALLADPDEPRVVYVHGPGGVGKTALLHQFAWLAEEAGRRWV